MTTAHLICTCCGTLADWVHRTYVRCRTCYDGCPAIGECRRKERI